MKPLVYISSPYTKGKVDLNLQSHCEVWDELFNDARVMPYAPLWSHQQQLHQPMTHAEWMTYDIQLIRSIPFAACLRVNAEVGKYKQTYSAGADAEVALFRELGRPVAFSIKELYKILFD